MAKIIEKSYRKRFMFWLDYKKQSELDLANEINNLKQTRSFARAIRDGLRLFVSLSKGETTVLEELFPHVVAKLRGGIPEPGVGGLSEEKLREIILEATRHTASNIAMNHLSGTSPSFKLPPPDDERPAIEVRAAGNSAKSGKQNFLNSLLAIQQG